MSNDDGQLKSAFEIAMERLQADDKKKGVQAQPLTEAQRAEIRKLREEAQAKLAELEILHRDRVAAFQAEPEKVGELEELENNYKVDRRRIESGLESRIERLKRGE